MYLNGTEYDLHMKERDFIWNRKIPKLDSNGTDSKFYWPYCIDLGKTETFINGTKNDLFGTETNSNGTETELGGSEMYQTWDLNQLL